MIKEFLFRGKTVEELKKMEDKDLVLLLKSRVRRALKKGFTAQQKKFILKLDQKLKGTYKKNLKTHCRELIILPKMIGSEIHVHSGKGFSPLLIMPEMIGHRLGEFIATRSMVKHNAPGVGATKSSTAIQAK